MSETKKHPINPDWEEYYQTLETIRQLGICNMWGAAPVLADFVGISQRLATDVLMSWITNYDELCEKYEWQ